MHILTSFSAGVNHCLCATYAVSVNIITHTTFPHLFLFYSCTVYVLLWMKCRPWQRTGCSGWDKKEKYKLIMVCFGPALWQLFPSNLIRHFPFFSLFCLLLLLPVENVTLPKECRHFKPFCHMPSTQHIVFFR